VKAKSRNLSGAKALEAQHSLMSFKLAYWRLKKVGLILSHKKVLDETLI